MRYFIKETLRDMWRSWKYRNEVYERKETPKFYTSEEITNIPHLVRFGPCK